jgi:hypothetical protein
MNEIEMDKTEIEYTIERARNLARELTIRGDNTLAGEDARLAAVALRNYRNALNDRRTPQRYGAVERVVIATYVDDMADSLMRRAHLGMSYGWSESELIARALTLYADELNAPRVAKAA